MADSAFSMYKRQLVKKNSTSAKYTTGKKINKLSLENRISPTTAYLNQRKKVNGTERTSKRKLKTQQIASKKQNNILRKQKDRINKRSLKHEILSKTARLISRQQIKDSKNTSKNELTTPKYFPSTISLLSSPNTSDFCNKPNQVLEWMIGPIKLKDFFKTYWEKAPIYIKRNQEHYYNQILSTEKLDKIFRENSLFYTKNVDVVSYVDGKRETHNPEGRAIPAALWDYYENGCSIRVLNPHTYCPKLHVLLARLQEYFGCMAGVNAYLTPPGSQGFAPHYDDIEAFVLQLEGRKHWKLYAPLTTSEVLPRFSSKNLDRNELKAPLKELTLEAGDMLYFPRGVIHEGFTDAGSHSLHVTVSVYQRTAYADLLEHILKPALTAAANDDLEFREGLPLQYLQHTGWANSDNSSEVRSEMITKVRRLVGKMINYISVDAAADQLGKQFMHDAMPPVPSKEEKLCMVHEDGDRMLNGKIFNKGEIHLELQVRLLRYHCLRLTTEDDLPNVVRIYYCTENAKYYHGEEQQFIDIDKALAPAVKCLINKYPQFVEVKSLPLENDLDKMQIVSDLWERGLLVTHQPLEPPTD